ncbi:unnamed protein product [Periconia digitata]|uniref:Uncharacterized protein n=1 Tax=Periconia digitata TaxID=1303443 RepID=A0A9W4UC82_9PLEO|nr:unnamed protein product [Periconia digitata]
MDRSASKSHQPAEGSAHIFTCTPYSAPKNPDETVGEDIRCQVQGAFGHLPLRFRITLATGNQPLMVCLPRGFSMGAP